MYLVLHKGIKFLEILALSVIPHRQVYNHILLPSFYAAHAGTTLVIYMPLACHSKHARVLIIYNPPSNSARSPDALEGLIE